MTLKKDSYILNIHLADFGLYISIIFVQYWQRLYFDLNNEKQHKTIIWVV